MKRVYNLFSALIMFVSVLNLVMIGRLFSELSLPALWFIGTNFMGILLGLLNFVRIRMNRRDWFTTTKAIASNGVCTLFYLLIALQLSTTRTWTVVTIAGILFLVSIFWKPVEENRE